MPDQQIRVLGVMTLIPNSLTPCIHEFYSREVRKQGFMGFTHYANQRLPFYQAMN